MKRIITFFIIGYLLNGPLHAQDNWSSEGAVGSSSQARHRAIGFSIGNKGYMGTGTRGSFGNVGYNEYKDFWEYDPVTKVWTQLADVGGTSRYDAVGFSVGDKGYIGIGRHLSPSSGDVILQDFWEYNKASNTWTNIGNMLGGPRLGAVAFTIGDKAYVGTGFTPSGGNSQEFFEFNPKNNNTWTQKKSFEGVGRWSAAGFAICGKGYIGTGLIATDTGINDFWEYDPGTNDWTLKSNYGGGACYAGKGFSICSRGFILKGAHNGVCDSKKFWEYNPTTNTWIQRTDIPSDFRFYPVAFNIKDKGYVGMGKKCGEETYFNDFLSYTPIDSDPPSQPGPIIGSAAACQNDVATYSISNVACANNYTWSVPPGASILQGQGSTTIEVVFGNTSGNIGVIANNDCGTSPIQVKQVVVNLKPNISVSGNNTICQGMSTILQAMGANSYVWSPTTGLNNPTSNNPSASPIQTTTYTVIGTTNNCTDTSTITITVKPKPNVTASGGITMCQGNSTELQASGAESYIWNPSLGLNNPNISNPIASPTISTLYNVIGSTNGCSDTANVSVQVNPTPLQPQFAQGSSLACFMEPISYSVVNDPSATYTWNLPSGWSGSSSSNSIVGIPGNSGTITVTAVSGMCSSLIQTIVVTVKSKPNSPDTIFGPVDLCINTPAQYFVPLDPNAVYFNWQYPGTWSGMDSLPSNLLTADTSGQIFVTAVNECGTSTPAILDVNIYEGTPNQPSAISGSPVVNCGSSQNYSVLHQSDASGYLWILPGGWSGTSQTNEIHAETGNSGGIITVYAINPCGQFSLPQVINVNIPPVNTSVAVSEIKLMALANNATYQWLECPGYVVISGANQQTYNGVSGHSYAVEITENGCIDTSDCMLVIATDLDEPGTNDFDIILFPNPAKSEFNLRIENTGIKHQGTPEIKLFDVFGNQLPIVVLSDYNGYNISLQRPVPNGLYIVQLKDNSSSIIIKPLIIQE